MSDYNNQNNLDKRLKQDDVEQEEKAKASTGMLIAALVVIIGIIVGIYLYNRPVEVQTVTTVQPAPVTTTTPETAPATPTATTTTPADVTAPATSQ